MSHPVLDCAGKRVILDRPRVMGILNATPDSFSDGGLWTDHGTALAHAGAMAEAGADIIDIGGESTRPGAQAVSIAEEQDRVIPLVEALSAELDIPVSIDTSKPEIMQAAVQAGAGMINDVYALRQQGALAMAAKLGVPVCLMHMQGEPREMQQAPQYGNVVREVETFLRARALACTQAGIGQDQIVLDPGFGFGKTFEHNLSLFQALPRLTDLDYPILVGISRKSVLGKLAGRPVEDRMAASLAAALLAAQSGAMIIRVHDVAETVDTLRAAEALQPGWDRNALER